MVSSLAGVKLTLGVGCRDISWLVLLLSFDLMDWRWSWCCMSLAYTLIDYVLT